MLGLLGDAWCRHIVIRCVLPFPKLHYSYRTYIFTNVFTNVFPVPLYKLIVVVLMAYIYTQNTNDLLDGTLYCWVSLAVRWWSILVNSHETKKRKKSRVGVGVVMAYRLRHRHNAEAYREKKLRNPQQFFGRQKYWFRRPPYLRGPHPKHKWLAITGRTQGEKKRIGRGQIKHIYLCTCRLTWKRWNRCGSVRFKNY